MSEENIKIIKREINSFASKKNINIDLIIFFGSRAQGKANPESDVDLLLVSKDFRNLTYSQRIKNMLGINRLLVKLTDLPYDIIYCSDLEWNNPNSSLIATAKKYGKIIS